MKYMMLIHQGPGIGEFESLPEDEKKEIYRAYKAITDTPGVNPGLQLQRLPGPRWSWSTTTPSGACSSDGWRISARRRAPPGDDVMGNRMSDTISVLDQGRPVAFSFEDMIRYHGPGSPGGVAHAFKVLERALPLLGADGPPERREITVRTAFGGPGARDAFELATRAVTEDRYTVDPSLARPERGLALERFVFRLGYRDRTVTLILREGYVTDEFIALTRREDRTSEDERRLARWKLEMAERVMAAAAAEVYSPVD